MRRLGTFVTSLTLLGLTATGACAATLVVNSTADPGAGGCTSAECTLREAIDQANTVGNTTIAFKIPTSDPGFAGGVFTIKPTSELSALVLDGIIVDGTTEAAFLGSDPNPNGPDIVLNGSLAGAGADGVEIRFPSNCAIKGLVINGFDGNGVRIFSETGIHDAILGCYIGTNASGTAAVPNGGDGVHIQSSAASNYIGGTAPGTGNLISGNAGSGIQIIGSDSNLVRGNLVGTDRTGTGAIPNQLEGVYINGSSNSNTVGGNTPESRNVISGNTESGLVIEDSSNNAVRGNYIGTDVTGTQFLINSNAGVGISGALFGGPAVAQHNTVGGTVAGARNVICANAGVFIEGGGATLNTVQGNYIGTNASGTAALYPPNVTHGVLLAFGTQSNLIGGTSSGTRNVICGDTGVHIQNAGTDSNRVWGNYIGTNAAGTAALNNTVAGSTGPGVRIELGAQKNSIGGTAAGSGNVISGNAGDGVEIDDANNNLVRGNFIGLNAAGSAGIPNNHNGVLLHNGATLNSVGGTVAAAANRIAFNKRDGVLVARLAADVSTPARDAVVGNRIYRNGGLGINLQPSGEAPSTATPNDPNDPDGGPNQLQNVPVLTSAIAAGGNTVIDGTLNSLATTQFFIDFYSSTSPDPSGSGEGEVYLGRTNANTNVAGNAKFSFTFAGNLAGQFITATATDPSSNTSEFCRARAAVPKLSISDLRLPEGNSGTTDFTFTITLSAASTQTVTVDVQTIDGTAAAPADYTAVPLGTRTFLPGTTSKIVTVAVKGELLHEADETFKVVLSNPTKAIISVGTATGFILNDDASE